MKRRFCLVALMLSLSLALSACSPRDVVLKTIPAEVIPDEWKAFVHGIPERPVVSDVVWRVYEIKDGRLFVACTFTAERMPGVGAQTMYGLWLADLDKDGQMTGKVWGTWGAQFETYLRFQGFAGSTVREVGTGERAYSLEAMGYCLDGRVKFIQGTTTEGQVVKTKPSGGFWHLELEKTGPTEAWASVLGIDRSGKPVPNMTIRP